MAAPPPKARVWVLPNRQSLGLVAVLLAMWYAGASQSNGAAYLLCFVLGALALVSVVHARANMRGLAVSADPIYPAFAGDRLNVPLVIQSLRQKPHFAIRVSAGDGKTPAHFAQVSADRLERSQLQFTAARRGYFRQLPLRVSSLFPLGFFTARWNVIVTQSFYVYPAPAGSAPLPRAFVPTRQARDGTRVAGDDFGGARAWRVGESQRHIDWKAAARGQPLLTKQWTGDAEEILSFDWQSLASLGAEARLSQLARWIVLAESGTASYELILPGEQIPAGRGDKHYHRCLRALALFVEKDSEATS